MKTLVVVHAHAGVESIMDRHARFWEASGDVLYTSPLNAPITGRHSVKLGCDGYVGPESIRRFRTVWGHLLQLSYDLFQINEYDSFCLGPVPLFDGLQGNLFFNSDPKYESPIFFQAPWILNRPTLERIVAAMGEIPTTLDAHFCDRVLGAIVLRENIPWAGYADKGISWNLVAPQEIAALKNAVTNGAVAIHGIKTEAAFDAAVAAYDPATKRILGRSEK